MADDESAREEPPSSGPAHRAADRPIADKINRLFDIMRPVGRPPYSTREMARRIKQHGGKISPAYLSDLRTGKRTNPSMQQCEDIARGFGVSAGYFTRDPELVGRVDAELDRLEDLHRNPELGKLAEDTISIRERTASLDDSERAALAAMVEDFWRRRREQHSVEPGNEKP